MATTSCLSTASSCSTLHQVPFLCSRSGVAYLPYFKEVRLRRRVSLKVNCTSEWSNEDARSQNEENLLTSSSESPSSSSSNGGGDGDDKAGISPYTWCAALGGLGLLETCYLTYLKLSNTDAFCPTGGASCNTILTSDYSSVFGVPLPVFGMVAYGLVTVLGLQLSGRRKDLTTGKSDGEYILIGLTTAMAVSSADFLYILSTEFSGETCLYCLASAILSFSLLVLSIKGFGPNELQKVLGLQLTVASLVVIALSASYSSVQSASSSMDINEIPYFETPIAKESSPFAISLAKHLKSIGAKLYGAFWCSHCQDQKEILGREATKLLDYVECFPNGLTKDNSMTQACVDAELKGFPSWSINGQILDGEKQLSELATLSGFDPEDSRQ